MSVPHHPLQVKVGHVVTRFMMRDPIRKTAIGRRTYATMYLAGKRLAERRERALLRRHLRPGMTVFDVGANVGFYTAEFSRQVGPSGRVHAFEPDPFCSDVLRHRSRRLDNVHVENAAVGSRRGEVTLFCSNRDRAESRTRPFDPEVPAEPVRVPMLTIDGYCRRRGVDRVDAVKMDVEGDEVRVLRGMTEMLALMPPVWMFIEFCPAHLCAAGSAPEELWELLAEGGYRFYSTEAGGELRRIRDTRAFTESHVAHFTNILAMHETAPA